MKLSTALKNLNSDKDIDNFLKDLCTPAEIEAMQERWEVAQLLYKGDSTYRDIASKLNTSTATVTRVARFLFKESNKGYLSLLKQD
ncbi:MAG: YerC/YecD family TrpR-related protein [Gammaproteobacteria bacterium]|uniref:Transcriptional regulator n=1 Tax=SAR86 cluster bacterium TaxID=2030880 RepID=A0A368BRH6_9GAMM|nr:MAG: transcriptional regulator [SAR86 cluster bacterium]|tara:strand:- start:500 stop:757 length:258 start_codon:yes stop_codon:yes gene_type:complete